MTALAEAAERFAAGSPVLVGELGGAEALVAASTADVTPQRIEAVQELGGDMLVLGLDHAIASRLGLDVLRSSGRRRAGIPLVTPIDAADCRGGWSLGDQAHTIRVATAPQAGPADLAMPGHVHTGRVDGSSAGSAALALELARVAGQPGAAVLSAVLDRAGRPVSIADARRSSSLRSLAVAPSDELIAGAAHRRSVAELPSEADTAACLLPSRGGLFRAVATAGDGGGDVTMTLVHGDPTARPGAPVRTHVACLLGHTFGSLLCDCRSQLDAAVQEIVSAGAGTLVYVKRPDGDPFACPQTGGAAR